MFEVINFEAFLIAGLLLNLTPEADTMYLLSCSASVKRPKSKALCIAQMFLSPKYSLRI